MKRRLFAGLMAIALGLSGCGVTENADIVETTVNTTTATPAATAAPKTTTGAKVTTPPAETTPSQTITAITEPVHLSDDEETLKSYITKKTNEEILFWEYGDFDNDGEFEAFVFSGEKDQYNIDKGTIYLVNSNGETELIPKAYYIDIFTFKFDDLTFLAVVYRGTNDRSRIWGVDGKEIYEPLISKIGQDFKITENGEMTILQSTYDAFTMFDEGSNGAHTWKPYYFYYDNGFREYGGTEISLEELLTYKNADIYVDEIKNLRGEITNILIRGNGIININYKVRDPDVYYLKWNYYYTLKITDDSVTHITEYPDNPEWDSGIYSPALRPEIAEFPVPALPVNEDGLIKNNIESQIIKIIDSDLPIDIRDIEYCDIDFDGIDEIIVLTGGYPHRCLLMII